MTVEVVKAEQDEFANICLICLYPIRDGEDFGCTLMGCHWNENPPGKWGQVEHLEHHNEDCIHHNCDVELTKGNKPSWFKFLRQR